FLAPGSLGWGNPGDGRCTGRLLETIVQGKTGWTYPVGDVEALTACLEEAIDSPEEAKRRAMAGRAMVQARFEEKLVFDRFHDVVTEQINETRKSAGSREVASPV